MNINQIENSKNQTDPIFRTEFAKVSASEISDVRISSFSVWGDKSWKFDNSSHGGKKFVINWHIELSDGAYFTDERHSYQLYWVKMLAWSLFAAPSDESGSLKGGSVSNLSQGLRYFSKWLVDNHISCPSEINLEIIKTYIHDLSSDHLSEDEEHTLSETVAWTRLMPLSYLWRQRFVLQRVGIPSMPDPPFGNGGAMKVARRIAQKLRGQLEPLPDEIATRVLNTAMRMIGAPAEDVIHLVSRYRSNPLDGKNVARSRLDYRNYIETFIFSGEDGVQWEPPLSENADCSGFVDALETRINKYLRDVSLRWASTPDPKGPMIPVCPGYSAKHLVDYKEICRAIGLSPSKYTIILRDSKLFKKIEAIGSKQGCAHSGKYQPSQRLRQLVISIRTAAQIVIQGTTGLRISEICGLRSGIDPSSGLPSGVRIEESASGFGDVFILTSEQSKSEERPREVEWTLGFRPKGDTRLPPAVRAMLVLDRLFESFRSHERSKFLLLGFTNLKGLPSDDKGVNRPLSIALGLAMNEFISEWVDFSDLPDTSSKPMHNEDLKAFKDGKNKPLKSHQWRKTFSNFVYRVDPKMLPALQMHFKHTSTAVTDSAYVTKNALLLRDLHDARHQHSALLALEIAEGSEALAGRRGASLSDEIKRDLSPRIQGLARSDAYSEAFAYIEESGLSSIFYEQHGICAPRSASEMSCHRRGDSTVDARWRRSLAPNYSTREPSVCAGCGSFAVTKAHLSFWENRYIECITELRQYEQLQRYGLELSNSSELTAARARQAFQIAKKLGADPDVLEMRTIWQDSE